MEKRTPLFDRHIAAGGRMVPFAGYMLPVQYETGVIAEHNSVRSAAGLFDVSHMGEFIISGANSLPFLQRLLCNDLSGLQAGGCRYSPMLNYTGGVVDDLIVYKYTDERFMLVVNASNKQKDWDWITALLPASITLDDASMRCAELALQGPKAEAILSRLVDKGSLPDKYYTFAKILTTVGARCLVSRTGYTGEDGFEIFCGNDNALLLWDALLDAGRDDGLIPCGLGARDTLRLESAMPLYGHELSDTITPLEAGLGSFVKMDKPYFIGKTALIERGEPSRRRRGLKVTGRGIAREGCGVYDGDVNIGVTTSGTMLPHAGYAGAMALLRTEYKKPGAIVEVDIRGRRVTAEIVKLPFYKKS